MNGGGRGTVLGAMAGVRVGVRVGVGVGVRLGVRVLIPGYRCDIRAKQSCHYIMTLMTN